MPNRVGLSKVEHHSSCCGLVLLMGVLAVWVSACAINRPMPTGAGVAAPPSALAPSPTPPQTPLALSGLTPFTVGSAARAVEVKRLGKGRPFEAVYSPDGSTLAVSSSVGIYFYDTRTWTEKGFWDTGAQVFKIAFSADGTWLASVSGGSVQLWDVANGQVVQTLPESEDGNGWWTLALSPDGTLVALVSNSTVQLWDVTNSQTVQTWWSMALGSHGHYARASAAFSPDGKLLAVGEASGQVSLWDITSGQTRQVVNGFAVTFSPDGKLLGTESFEIDGVGDGTTTLREVASGQVVRTFNGHKPVFSPDGKLMAVRMANALVKLWDVASEQLLQTVYEPDDWMSPATFSPDGKLLVGTWGDTVTFLDVASGQVVRTLAGYGGATRRVAFTPHGDQLLSVSDTSGKTMTVWEVANGQVVHSWSSASAFMRWAAALSPDGTLFASEWVNDNGAGDYAVKLWKVKNGQVVQTLGNFSQGVQQVAFSPDGTQLAIGLWDAVTLWNVASGQKLQTLSEQPDLKVTSLAFSPDGTLLAVGGPDGVVHLWNLVSGGPIQILTPKVVAHARYVYGVNSIAFSPDGKLLAWGISYADSQTSHDAVIVWDVANRQEVQLLSSPNVFWGYSLAFSPDGTLLAGGEQEDNQPMVTVWDVAGGQKLKTLRGPTDEVASVAFSPDGKLLASGATDGTVRLWGVPGP